MRRVLLAAALILACDTEPTRTGDDVSSEDSSSSAGDSSGEESSASGSSSDSTGESEPLTVCEQVLECLAEYWDADARRCTTGYSECYPTEEACRCPHRYECDAAVCEY